jgi:hypothetical protein
MRIEKGGQASGCPLFCVKAKRTGFDRFDGQGKAITAG